MASLASFAKYVRPSVPGCPEPVLLDAILRACINYCARTKLITETSDITTVIATNEYALTLTTGYEVVDVIYVKRDGNDLTPSSERMVDINTFEDTGSPVEFYLSGENKVTLVPTPDAVETLTAKVSVAPTVDATTVPDALLTNQRIDVIASGAKSFLQLMDNKPWSNTEKAAVNNALFENGIATEQVKRAKGGIRQPIRTTGAYF